MDLPIEELRSLLRKTWKKVKADNDLLEDLDHKIEDGKKKLLHFKTEEELTQEFSYLNKTSNESSVMQLKQDLEEQKKLLNTETESLQLDVERSKETLFNLQEELQKYESSKTKDLSVLEEVIDLSELQEELKSLESKESKLRTQLKDLETSTHNEEFTKLDGNYIKSQEQNTNILSSISEAQLLLENLEGEKAILQMDYNMLNKSVESNSMFNEVNDRRMQLENEMSKLKKEYSLVEVDELKLNKAVTLLKAASQEFKAFMTERQAAHGHVNSTVACVIKRYVENAKEVIRCQEMLLNENKLLKEELFEGKRLAFYMDMCTSKIPRNLELKKLINEMEITLVEMREKMTKINEAADEAKSGL